MRAIFLLLSILVLFSCRITKNLSNFQEDTTVIDYSNLNNWAAHPDKLDPSDSIPAGLAKTSTKPEFDVFFVYPTSYTKDFKGWNARIDDQKINRKTDNSSILFQASVFNENARIFVPRYRQAHLKAFFTEDKVNAKKALDFAYADVKAAFEYYLKYENKGRPIVIAGHSQGMQHASQLVKMYFDGKELSQQLIVAYLVGLPLKVGYFSTIKPCASPEETGCACSWRTYKSGHLPKIRPADQQIVVTNPLSWTLDERLVPKSANKLAILRNFNQQVVGACDAQVHDGVLWTHLSFKGSSLIFTPNYHVGDYNLFWGSIRDNVRLRSAEFMKKLR